MGCDTCEAQASCQTAHRRTLPNMTADTWTPENTALLKQLWADGWTGSRIADRIPGTTRSSVIGKVHRLQLPPRKITVRKFVQSRGSAGNNDRHRLMRRHKTKTKVRIALESAGVFADEFGDQFEVLPVTFEAGGSEAKPPQARPEDVASKSIVELEDHHCKWPCGEQSNLDSLVYCGGDRLPGLPYCESHAKRAYRPERPAKGLFRLTALDFDARTNPRFVDNREPEPAELEQTTP